MSKSWWRHAAIYQVYVRSFADSTGDGIGDLRGIRARLPYLRELGVDALWINPWYTSPMADAGYDVADYRDVDPLFGTLADAEALIAEAHALDLRVIIDIVPNHCSDQHPWFREALAAGPGSAARDLFWFRPGRDGPGPGRSRDDGPGGDGGHGREPGQDRDGPGNDDRPPNNWSSIFGGPAWTRAGDGEWYLHLFAPQQPDFNWDNPKVREEFEDILRFWFRRGADGVRIDSAAVVVKDPALADFDPAAPPPLHPFTDRDEVHEIYRGWRRVADAFDGRVLIGEIWLPDPERFALYLRPDELHTAFNFDFLGCPWSAAGLRDCIEATLAAHAPVGAPPTWVLSNHDVVRHVTRYGRQDTSFTHSHRQLGAPTDRALGTRRARAAALLAMALPGSFYLYQGEELGLWEVEALPDEVRQDPVWERSGHTEPGRDGCRVPIPWDGTEPPFGFSPTGRSWLPQPPEWRNHTVAAESADPDSMLSLYRAALRLRRDLTDEPMTWLPAHDGLLAFSRGPDFVCVANLSGGSTPLPTHQRLLIASGPLDAGLLPTDTAVWLRP